jgi:hypothetical protein
LIKIQAFQSIILIPVLRSAEVEIVKSKSSENEAGAANNTFQFREENKWAVLLMSISEI